MVITLYGQILGSRWYRFLDRNYRLRY